VQSPTPSCVHLALGFQARTPGRQLCYPPCRERILAISPPPVGSAFLPYRAKSCHASHCKQPQEEPGHAQFCTQTNSAHQMDVRIRKPCNTLARNARCCLRSRIAGDARQVQLVSWRHASTVAPARGLPASRASRAEAGLADPDPAGSTGWPPAGPRRGQEGPGGARRGWPGRGQAQVQAGPKQVQGRSKAGPSRSGPGQARQGARRCRGGCCSAAAARRAGGRSSGGPRDGPSPDSSSAPQLALLTSDRGGVTSWYGRVRRRILSHYMTVRARACHVVA